jgi:hypothetical protein
MNFLVLSKQQAKSGLKEANSEKKDLHGNRTPRQLDRDYGQGKDSNKNKARRQEQQTVVHVCVRFSFSRRAMSDVSEIK